MNIDKQIDKTLYPYVDTDTVRVLRNQIKKTILKAIMKEMPKKKEKWMLGSPDIFNRALEEFESVIKEILK